MKKSLINGVSKPMQASVKENFNDSQLLRRVLKERILKKVDEARAFTIGKKAYEIENWEYLQSDAIGYERAMKEVLSLIE